MNITLPPFPIPPAADASAADRQVFVDACAVYDLALRLSALLQADADQAHRDRMAAATEANGAALRAVADKTEVGPSLADRKRNAVLDLLGRQARGTRTPAKFVSDVQAQVELAFAAAPGTVTGAA